MSKELSKEFCENVAFLLSKASVDEALIDKPGNASRYKDISTVKFSDIVYSSLVIKDYYKEACLRKFERKSIIYDLLYYAIKRSKLLGINFSIFGTVMQLLPIAYASSLSLSDTVAIASQLIKALDEKESYYFSLSLKELNLSYLGKLSIMDYRSLQKFSFYDVLVKSSEIDSAVRNIIENYKYSLYVVEEIKKKGFTYGVLYSFLKILCDLPDGLIFRKYGGKVAIEVSKYACEVLNTPNLIKDFDSYLISNNLNPGSTADIIATGIALYYLDEWYKKNSLNYTGTLQRGCDRFS